MAGITYAGQPLLLEDPDHQFQHWLDRLLSLAGERDWAWPSVPVADPTWLHRFQCGLRIGIPRVNWPTPPQPRLNTLVWPTGATRWGCGWFLVDADTLGRIQQHLEDDQSAKLEIVETAESAEVEPNPKKISVSMWMLPPRPVSTPEFSSGLKQFYILTLVDVRYLWQYRYGDLHDCDTWTAILQKIGEHLDQTIVYDEIPAAYLAPDRGELWRDGLNMAVALDAVAWSIGMRVVYGWDGHVYLCSPSGSTDIDTGNTTAWPKGYSREIGLETDFEEKDHQVMAGGEGPPGYAAPEKVSVWFPIVGATRDTGVPMTQAENHWEESFTAEQIRTACEDACYDDYVLCAATGGEDCEAALERCLAACPERGYAGETVPGTEKVFWSTAMADMCGGAYYSPTNGGELQALAEQIARDYYAWLEPQYDWTFAGLKYWFPSGRTDYVQWRWGELFPGNEAGDYLATTRVASLPQAVGVSAMLQQLPDVTQCEQCGDGGGGDRWFCLTSDLIPGGTATARDLDTNEVFTVTDKFKEHRGTAKRNGGIASLKNGEWRTKRMVCGDFEVEACCDSEVS